MQIPDSSRRLLSAPALWVFCITLIIRVLVLSRFAGTPFLVPKGDDMFFYHSWALRIMGGQWTDHHAFYGLPGYAFLLALAYLIVGIQPFVVGLLQVGVEALTSVVIYRLGCESFASVRTNLWAESHPIEAQWIAILAAVGWAVFLPAQAFSIILMPTCWLVLAFWGCLLWLSRVRTDSLWKPWLGVGVLIGFVAVFVATILFLWPIALASICLNVGKGTEPGRRWLRRTGAAGVFVAGVFAGASPAWIHNYFVAGEPVLLSAHSGLNLWIGNNPFASGYPRIPPGLRASQDGLLRDSISLAQKITGKELTRSEVSKFWSERANQWIRENRLAWFRLLGTKFSNFWNTLQYDDLSIIKLLQNDGVLTPGIRFGLVSALGLPGLLLGVIRVRQSRWIAAGVLLHMAALMPVFITERYRLCAVPGLLLFSAYLLVTLWQSLISRRWGLASLMIVMTIGSTCFVTQGRPDPSNWSLDHYRAGIRFLDSEKLDDAERELTKAYAYVPDNAEIVFALGNLRFQQKNNNAARFWYRKSLEMNPNHAGAWNNAGVVALEEKRWDIAERAFVNSLRSDPDDAKTYYLLARARLELGNRQGALDAIEEAVRRAPRQKVFLEFRQQIIEGKPAPR
jgi:tetratricopeptide (TPR) repeat protein